MAGAFWAQVRERRQGAILVEVGFGEPAQNGRIVPDAIQAMKECGLNGGPGLFITGPASLPAAAAIAHEVGHRFGFVAWFDPKLDKFVVAISHDPGRQCGDLLTWG